MLYPDLTINEKINAKHNALFVYKDTVRTVRRWGSHSAAWISTYSPDRMILSKHREQPEPRWVGEPDYDAPSAQELSEKAYKQKYELH